MSERERFDTSREAVAAAAHHADATAERYRAALNRYLAAIRTVDERGAPPRPSPREWYVWNLENNLVRDVMTRDVVSVTEDTPFKAIVDVLATYRVSAVPVVDADHKVVGVVSESDLLAKVVAGGDPRVRIRGHAVKAHTRRKSHAETARELMSAPVVTTRPEASIVQAARIAAIEHVRRMPVVDADGVLVGIVSRSDLLQVFLRADEDLRDQIASLFAERFRIDATAIDIAVHDGIVSLTGQVERRGLITPLLDAVRAMAGVVGLHNNLTYRVDDTFTPTPHQPLY